MKKREETLSDLENIYTLALAHENYSVALRAKELIGKAQGLFRENKPYKMNIEDLTDQELAELIQKVENELDQGN